MILFYPQNSCLFIKKQKNLENIWWFRKKSVPLHSLNKGEAP